MTRLRPAYARDVLSFLDYAQLQKCRLVSQSVNANIVGNPLAIRARRQLAVLGISVESGEVFDYLPSNSDLSNFLLPHKVHKRQCHWKEVQEEWGCCREELEDLAATLVGEPILPAHPADSVVEFRIEIDYISLGTSRDSKQEVILKARNKMTAETAFGVLHLLEHLRHVYFSFHFSQDLGDVDGADCSLNPSIVQLLSADGAGTYRLHVEKYDPKYLPGTADKLAQFKLRELGLHCETDGNPQVVFDFAMHAKLHCKRILLSTSAVDHFDAALQHFQRVVPRIGGDVVSELALSLFDSNNVVVDDFWPADLPPKEEMEALDREDEDGTERYRLQGDMTNFNSGEHFEVMVFYKRIVVSGMVLSEFEMSLFFR